MARWASLSMLLALAMAAEDPVATGFGGPAPFFVGTATFIGIAIVACLVVSWLGNSGRIALTDKGLGFTLITTAAICMWMMWAMAWLHQWHPLILPEKDTTDK